MFKVFLYFLIFFAQTGSVYAQTAFSASKDVQEKTLSKFLNATTVCAKMTDSVALYERGVLLLSDANDEAYLAASECFTSAALKNHTPSQLELGKLYEKGLGINQSNVYAYKWYQTAVLLGNQEAVPFRNQLEARMTLDEIALANPMIQSTLDLIQLFEQRKIAELESFEHNIAQQYKTFGVDISQYDDSEDAEQKYENPLIDALIREQQNKNTEKNIIENENMNNFNPREKRNKHEEEETKKTTSRRFKID